MVLRWQILGSKFASQANSSIEHVDRPIFSHHAAPREASVLIQETFCRLNGMRVFFPVDQICAAHVGPNNTKGPLTFLRHMLIKPVNTEDVLSCIDNRNTHDHVETPVPFCQVYGQSANIPQGDSKPSE